MTTIRQLSPSDTLEPGDAVPFSPSAQGDARRFSLNTLTDFLAGYFPSLARFAQSDGATLIGYQSVQPNAIASTVAGKLGEVISVKDYGAIGDGVADDTASVTLAVIDALAAGAAVFWPDGTFLTTDSIPSLHLVRHVGSGIIKRGSALWYVSPTRTQTNTLYVATTGVDTNDGLSSSQPRRTIQGAVTAFLFAGSVNNPCVVSVAAGTYNEAIAVPDYQAQSDGYLTIKGPDTATVRTTPTCVIDGTALTPNAAVDCGRGNKVKTQNLLYTNWTSSIDCVQAGVGTLAWMVNNQSLDSSARSLGIADRGAVMLATGGGKVGGLIGFDCYSGSTLTVGYNATNTTDSTFIRNTTQAGFYLKSHVHAVSNYGDYTDNALVVYGYHNARFDAKGDNYKRNTRVFKLLGSYVSEDIALPPVFNFGGADANSIAYELDQYSAEDIYHASGRGGLDVAHQRSSTTVTGTAANTLARTLKTIPGYGLTTTGRYIEVECVIAGTGAVGTKTVQLQLGSTVIGTYTLASGTASGKFRALIWASNTTSVLVINEVSGSLTLVTALRTTPLVDMTVSQNLSVWLTVPGAADTAIMHEARCVLWG